MWGSRVVAERVLMFANEGSCAVEVMGRGDLALLTSTVADHPHVGVWLVQSRLTAVNAILWGSGGAAAEVGTESLAVIDHCDVAGGEDGVLVTGDGQLLWLDGNLDADPLYEDAPAGDYRLSPDSPCRDAGTAYFAWDGRQFVSLAPDDYCGPAPDLGAFERCDVTAIVESAVGEVALLAAPNPFNPATAITCAMPAAGHARLTILDARGRLVATILDEACAAGRRTLVWDGRDDRGRRAGATRRGGS